jgi:ribosomal subunit interface protein
MDVRELEISVTTRGEIPAEAREYAVDKINQLTRYTRKPILFAQLKLSVEPNPAQARPAVAEATLDVNGQPVRAHVAGSDLMEAADLLEDRLRRNLVRHTERHEPSAERRALTPADGEWRHGSPPTERPDFFDRPIEDREVVRHKTFALDPMTTDEASLDLELLGHDFYLFTEVHTGAEALLHVTGDGGLELQQVGGRTERPSDCHDSITVGPPAPDLTLAEATERLDVGHEPTVFFVDADAGRGQVVYRRYDGHYGLITPG